MAEIYKGDSNKSNDCRQPLGLLLVKIKYRNNKSSDPEGSAKSPLAGSFCMDKDTDIWDFRTRNHGDMESYNVWMEHLRGHFIDNMAYLPYTKHRKEIGDYNG